MSEVYLVISLSDGSVTHMAFQTEFRSPRGLITREANDVNIEFEISRFERSMSDTGKQVVTWRRITDEEHDLFGKDRIYRNALTMIDNKISHDMPKARELHRARLRAKRSEVFPALDIQYMRALGKKDQIAADVIEVQRQVLRDLPVNPLIDTAQTVEELKTLL